MRESNDMFMLWKTAQYFRPQKVLEIGFSAGQSLGLIYEATGCTAELTAVDIDFSKKNVFDMLYPDAKIKCMQLDSLDLDLDSKFDMIHVDGKHDFEHAHSDICKCLDLCHDNSILIVDDYPIPDVTAAINATLMGQYNFVPFMQADQGMYFHHQSQFLDDFLDHYIQKKSCNFIFWHNVELNGYTVLESRLPNLFVENRQIFQQALQFYNL